MAAREIAVRVPFSREIGMEIEKEAREMSISYSAYMRMLLDKGRKASAGSEFSSLLKTYKMSYDKYIVVYVSEDTNVKIKAIAPGIKASKIYSCLVQRGRDAM